MKISIRKYAQALAEALIAETGQAEKEEKIQNFLAMLRKKKKTKLLKRFVKVFTEVWDEKNHRLRAKVTLPHEPSDKEKNDLAASLGEVLKKEIIMDIKVEEEIIGGLKMEFGDTIIDGTVRKNLEMLKTKLAYSNI